NPEVAGRRTNTRFVEENLTTLLAAAASWKPNEIATAPVAKPDGVVSSGPAGTIAVAAPMQGKVVSISVSQGDAVRKGAPVAVLEAMKMEHLVGASISGRVHSIATAPGDVLFEGGALLYISPEEIEEAAETAHAAIDPDTIRPDL